MGLLEHRRPGGEVLELDRRLDDLGGTAARSGLERARADEADRRGALPADVDHDRVAERGTLPDEAAVLLDEVDEVPVQPGVQPRREAGGDVGREHGRGEQHGVVAALFDHFREDVDARLRERRLEDRVVGDPDLRGAGGLRGEIAHARAGDHPGRLTERGRLGQDAERAFLELAVVVLEEDQRRHQTSFFSTRKSRICWAAVPSSSILRLSPRGGGAPSASTSVFDPASPDEIGRQAELVRA